MKKNDQDALMISYLLGELPEEEQLRLEEQFFTDDDNYQQLLAVEDELRYEYAQGGLTAKQRQLFEQRFLKSAEDRSKVELAEAVLNKAFEVTSQRAAVAAPLRADQPRTSWWQALSSVFFPNSPALRFSFAAAAFAVVVVGSWSLFQTVQLRDRLERMEAQRRTEQQTAQQQASALEQERSRRQALEQELSKRQEPTTFLSFVLSPGLVRSGDTQKPLVVPADSPTVRLQLDAKPKASYTKYRAEVQTLDGKQIWSQDVATPVLSIPGRLLSPDDYMVALKGITAAGDAEFAGEFYFTVVRK